MKLFRFVLAASLLLAVSATTGCAYNGKQSTAFIGDENALVKPNVRIDRTVVKSSQVEGAITEYDVVQVELYRQDGTPIIDPQTGLPKVTVLVREGRSTPLAGDLVRGAVPGIATGIVQGEYAKDIAKIGQCPDGAICNSNILINENTAIGLGGAGGQGGSAAALSGSSSNAASRTNVGISGCPGPNCGAF